MATSLSEPTKKRIPVSYTHLDVYKRQDMGGAMQCQVCGKRA